MCEFQKVTDDGYSICLYTKSLCTLCVLGNKSIYNKAVINKQDMEDNGNEQY